jgi:hypothetical protein
MSAMSTNARPEADRDQDVFWDLVAADRDLLRAEFDAVIAANRPADRAQRDQTPNHAPRAAPARDRPSRSYIGR